MSEETKLSELVNEGLSFNDAGGLEEQIQKQIADKQNAPSVPGFPKFVAFRAESEEIPPQESRYIVVGFKNFFPEKNIYSWDEIQELPSKYGVQVSVKK